MSNNSAHNDGGESGLVRLLAMIVAPLIFFVREPAVWLCERVYKGWSGALRNFLGVIFAFGASYAAGKHVGWELDYPTLAWLGAAAGAWFGTYFYAWPAMYFFVVKRVFQLVEKIVDLFGIFCKKYAQKTFNGFILGVGRVLPGSRRAWNVVLDEKRNSWINNLLGGLSYLASFGGSIYAGWQAYAAIGSLAFGGIPAVPFIAAVAGGLLAFSTLFASLIQLLRHGKIAFVATALGAALTWLYSGTITAWGEAAGLSSQWAPASLAVFFVAFIGYIFPYLNWTLSGDLVKKVIDFVGKLCDKTYGDKNEGYVKFFGHALNLVATAAIGWGAFKVCSLIGLAGFSTAFLPWFGLVITALVVFAVVAVAYLGVYDWLFDHRGGLGWCATIASVYTGYQVFSWYSGAGMTGGYWAAVPLGGLVALLFGTVAVPVVYLSLRSLLLLVRADKAGEPLHKLYNSVEEGFRKLAKHLEKVYEVSYRDRTGYQEWFLHAANLGVCAGLYFLSGELGSRLGWSNASTLFLAVPLVVLSYIVTGKFLLKSTVGTEFLGVISGLVAAIHVGTLLHAEVSSWWVTIGVGFFTWLLVVFLFFPLAYIAVRFLAKPLLAGWSLKLLSSVHAFAWSVFKTFADAVREVYKRIRAWALWKKIGDTVREIRQAYVRLRDRLSRKNS